MDSHSALSPAAVRNAFAAKPSITKLTRAILSASSRKSCGSIGVVLIGELPEQCRIDTLPLKNEVSELKIEGNEVWMLVVRGALLKRLKLSPKYR